MSAMLSPCTGVCTIAPSTGALPAGVADTGMAEGPPVALCIGCGRTIEEIGAWRDLDDDQRRRIMAALPARLAGQTFRTVAAKEEQPAS